MGEEDATALPPPDPQPPSPQRDSCAPSPKFNPSRMVGIIRRKALIKELAAAYHAECLDYCQELLELQRKWEEQIQSYADIKSSEDLRKDTVRPSKRAKRAC